SGAELSGEIEQIPDAGLEGVGRGRALGVSVVAQIHEHEAPLGAPRRQALHEAPEVVARAEHTVQDVGGGARGRLPDDQMCGDHRSVTSTTASTSTAAPRGSCATPNALRACCPASPSTATSSSEAPLMTKCWSVKSGAVFT